MCKMADDPPLICSEVCGFRGVDASLLTRGHAMKLLMSGSDCRGLAAVVGGRARVCSCSCCAELSVSHLEGHRCNLTGGAVEMTPV